MVVTLATAFFHRPSIRHLSHLKSVTNKIQHILPDHPHIEVTIPETSRDIDQWVKSHVPSKGHIGFDLEWRPNRMPGHPQNKVALVQYSTNNAALLIQMQKIGTLPDSLLESLKSKEVLKVGVGILDDMLKLKEDYGIAVGGYMDVGLGLKRTTKVKSHGLKTVFNHCYGVTVEKPKKVQMSNWEASTLSPLQIQYACHDALMGKLVHNYLTEKNLYTDKVHASASAEMKRIMADGSRSGLRRALGIAAESSRLRDELHHHFIHSHQPADILKASCEEPSVIAGGISKSKIADGDDGDGGGGGVSLLLSEGTAVNPSMALDTYLSRVGLNSAIVQLPPTDSNCPDRFALIVGGRIGGIHHIKQDGLAATTTVTGSLHERPLRNKTERRAVAAKLASSLLHELMEYHRRIPSSPHHCVEDLLLQYSGRTPVGYNPIIEFLEKKHRFYLSAESGEDLASVGRLLIQLSQRNGLMTSHQNRLLHAILS